MNCISQIDVGCKLGISRINVMAYADDMILLSPSDKETGVMSLLPEVLSFYSENLTL